MLRASGKLALLLFVLCALLVSQGVAADHSDRHSDHCCPACHVGHSVVMPQSVTLLLAQPDAIRSGHLFYEPLFFVPELLRTTSGSRAPPA